MNDHATTALTLTEPAYYHKVQVTPLSFDELALVNPLDVAPVNDAPVVHKQVASQITVAKLISDSCFEV